MNENVKINSSRKKMQDEKINRRGTKKWAKTDPYKWMNLPIWQAVLGEDRMFKVHVKRVFVLVFNWN